MKARRNIAARTVPEVVHLLALNWKTFTLHFALTSKTAFGHTIVLSRTLTASPDVPPCCEIYHHELKNFLFYKKQLENFKLILFAYKLNSLAGRQLTLCSTTIIAMTLAINIYWRWCFKHIFYHRKLWHSPQINHGCKISVLIIKKIKHFN